MMYVRLVRFQGSCGRREKLLLSVSVRLPTGGEQFLTV